MRDALRRSALVPRGFMVDEAAGDAGALARFTSPASRSSKELERQLLVHRSEGSSPAE